MRVISNFNQGWQFVPERGAQDAPDERFESVTLPHTNKLFARPSVDNSEYQFVSTYRKQFSIAQDLGSKHLFIDFDGVMLVSTVYVNGKKVGVHEGGFTPFSF